MKVFKKLSRPHKGFPKILPCLVCDKGRRSVGPGDRIHGSCKRRDQVDIEAATVKFTFDPSRGE